MMQRFSLPGFCRDRRGVTALLMALITLPMVICVSAAVDFSRISSARALMQESVDAAARAGVGAWQLSEQAGSAQSVAQQAYSATGAQLPVFVNTTAASVSLYCASSAVSNGQCGSGASYSSTAGSLAHCTTNAEYCISVSEIATLQNSLFRVLIPGEALSVTGYASAGFGKAGVQPGATSGTSTGSAFDYNGMYISAVPMNAGTGKPDFNSWSAPNTNCAGITGPLKYVPETAQSGATGCNYLFLGDSKGNSGSGTLTVAQDDPVAFTFVNYTGATTSFNFGLSYAYPNNILVWDKSGSSWVVDSAYGNGGFYNGTVTSPGTAPCSSGSGTNRCAFGICPESNLYGSLSQQSGIAQAVVPSADSLNIYYSAYEVNGLPPTDNTNHQLTPFFGEIVAFTANFVPTASASAAVYYAEAICPQSPLTAAQASTDANLATYGYDTAYSSTFTSAGASYVPADTSIGVTQAGPSLEPISPNTGYPATPYISVPYNVNLYATYYPTTNLASNPSTAFGTGYAPEIAGCTPAPYPNATGGTSIAQWWGWAASNSGTTVGSGNCANAPAASLQSSTTPYQKGNYNNCALAIQPLGTNAPASSGTPVLPDYYNLIETAAGTVVALDPVWDNTTYKDTVLGGSVVNSSAAGYTPSSTSSVPITSVNDPNGVFLNQQSSYQIVTEQPARNSAGQYDHSLPAVSSFQCYNPGNNGALTYGPTVYTVTGYDPTVGDTPDPIQDAHDGVVYCGLNPGASFALYWNDMGGGQSDDLGYWNQITEFTCPGNPGSNAGAGPSLLSG